MRGKLDSLRTRLKARPDTEHEQAIVRLAIGTLIGIYLLPGALAHQHPSVFVMIGYLAIAAIVLLHILIVPGESPTRRVFGTLADIATLTAVMAFLGERAAPLFLVYVWVTLANGFRFGQRYLLLSLGLSVAGFLFVVWQNDYWQDHRTFGYGLMLGLVLLSLYVRSLVTKLFDALAHAEAANVAKRRFISVVSHELRTPLNAIIGMADLMRDTSLSREQADMLQTLRSSSRVMLGLVDDVLDFSKIEAGKLVLEKADFDLHALVNSTCRILGAQAAAKGLGFIVSIRPEVPPALRGDPHHLRQVLINLAGNAVKFTERGSVTVHVSAQAETEHHVRLKFSIRDTGVGIPPEAQAKIFESFTQADQSTTRRFGGTGLGTTIAKQIVGLMGGTIGLESAVGLGTTFWVEIELEKQPERATLGTGELADARILLIGFPHSYQEAFTQSLGGWGANAFAVSTIEEAGQWLTSEISRAKPYHSAILFAEETDPKMVQRFRRTAPHPTPPLIVAVPREADVRRVEALSSGFTAVLELPFDKRFLYNVLHSVAAGDDFREGVVRLQDYARRGGTAQRLRVLVADDNPTNREVAGKILERGGHLATLVADGEMALDALERERHDIVLLDRNMPGLGGIETLQAIRLLSGGVERIPIVMLSADVTPEAKSEALKAGCDAFLSKPIEALRLLETIDSLVAAATEQTQRPEGVDVVTMRAPVRQPEVINRETLQHLEELGSSTGFLEKLVGIFVADNVILMSRIEQAVGARNYHELRSLLHAMKGSSASMGTDRLTAVCGALGRLSDAEIRLKGASLVRGLGEEFAAARDELQSYLSTRKQSIG